MKKLLFLILSLSLALSCTKEPNPVNDEPAKTFLSGPGAFVINEGNFRGGNGSVSYFSYDSMKVFNDIFTIVNQRPLGDIPYSMELTDSKAYIVVNNSGKIEVTDLDDLSSLATIKGLESPRYLSLINESKAYVTSLFSDSITIIDLKSNSITGYININQTSEAILTRYSTAYVTSWAGGNKIIIINTVANQVTDSIEVGHEPESMVIDRNDNLWVLCNGGWAREHFAELVAISTKTNMITKRIVFPSINDSPTCLKIDKEGLNLYFLNNGVVRMSVFENKIPEEVLIPQNDRLFYKLAVNPLNNEIFVTDVVDYVHRGKLLRYSEDGDLLSEFETSIIPGTICFR